jgi:hypothetical protein
MAISESELSEIESVLAESEAAALPFAALRLKYPHLTWSRCDASDVEEEPFRTFPAFDLHLLDNVDHCALITRDLARTTGLVVAARSTKP